MSAAFPIEHDEKDRLFEAWFDGQRAVLTYRLDERGPAMVMTIDHTGVPVSARGQGIAAALVGAAFNVARQRGWLVVPACSYAAVWAQRHADEVADLLA